MKRLGPPSFFNSGRKTLLSSLSTPAVNSPTAIELGDTGAINVRPVGDGRILFTITERGIERASVILDRDRVHGTIKALCSMTGVAVKQNGVTR